MLKILKTNAQVFKILGECLSAQSHTLNYTLTHSSYAHTHIHVHTHTICRKSLMHLKAIPWQLPKVQVSALSHFPTAPQPTTHQPCTRSSQNHTVFIDLFQVCCTVLQCLAVCCGVLQCTFKRVHDSGIVQMSQTGKYPTVKLAFIRI